METLIEQEKATGPRDTAKEAKVWRQKIAECVHKRSAYQDQQAAGLMTLERVMNSIRNSLGMRETEIAKEPRRPCNPHSYAVFAQVHNTL
jgi:hypothetical protein